MHLSEEEGAEITFSGRKLSVKSAAFPFVRPPVFPSLRTRARPSSRDPFVRLSPPLRQSLVRSPFAFPAREKSTRVYAKQRRSLPSRSRRERGAGEKSLGAVRFSSEAADAPVETEPRL